MVERQVEVAEASIRVFTSDATESGADRGGNRMLLAVLRHHYLATDGHQPVLLHRRPWREPPVSVGEKTRDEPGGLGLAHLVVSGQQYDKRFDVVGDLVRSDDQSCGQVLAFGVHAQRRGEIAAAGVIDEAEAPRRHHRAPGQRCPFLDDYLRSRVGVRGQCHRPSGRRHRRDAVVWQPQRRLVHLRVREVQQRKRRSTNGFRAKYVPAVVDVVDCHHAEVAGELRQVARLSVRGTDDRR